MAKKRKRKRNSLGASLKYEVYGILLITVSVIALSGEATVGRSLSKLFGLLLGKFYFVLALVGIYIGLVVMVKRAWPSGWTSRKTGILLLILGFTLMSSIAVMDQKTEPTGGLTASYILHELGSDVRGALIDAPSKGLEAGLPKQSVSGGYIGAIQYTTLYWLFGYFGAKFIMIVMFAIAIMLMTGKSYVDLAKSLRRRGGRLLSLMRMKFFPPNRTARLATSSNSSSRSGGGSLDDADILDDDDDEDFEQLPAAPRRRRSPIFSWFNDVQNHQEDGHSTVHDSDWQMEDGHPSPVQGQTRSRAPWEEDEDHGDDAWHSDSRELDQSIFEPNHSNIPETLPWDEEESSEYAEQPGTSTTLHQPTNPSVHTHRLERDDIAGEELPLPTPAVPLSQLSPAMETGDAESADGTQAVSRAPIEIPYQIPSFSLLARPTGSGRQGDTSDMNESRRKLEATLESFGVRAKVLDVVRGPAVTRYEVQPATGVKVSRIVGLSDDIALALAAKGIRMEAPIPGKSAIGIEVPNSEVSVVTMREVMETPSFLNSTSNLSIAFGRDISGQTIVGNLAKMPHLLVAGATGSGKSVCINGIITSILYKARPDEVKFLMIDPKMVELNVYNGIPHLLAPVVTDPRRASLALKKIVVEMEKRYEAFSKSGTRNIEGYNNLMAEPNPSAVLPYIVVIVDELADLMMVAANDVEDAICRLAQMARAAGIHLIIATQRPSVDVITGTIKANIPSRIAFGVSSQVDSRTILDMAGAEKLLGRGDMLFLPVGMSKPIRVQGAFLSDHEVEAVVGYCRGQAEAEYKEDLVPEIDDAAADNNEMLDELYDQAIRIVLEAKQASVSLLQRRMRIGYTRAARLIDQMEARGIVGPYEGSKPREVLLTMDQYDAGKISS
ncbi:DNA translocase FtsK 4TM domain-containing protein [Paenibacillus solisilvae]|uniref:DNA translocase FtsK 4TM domain-containing protein n=1 Tax=Paenibacillus solisilvae TaxID=2486751 RepID=A0ABW0VVE8_9BACL